MKQILKIDHPLLVFAHKGEAQAFLTHFKATPIHLPSQERLNLYECQQGLILLTGEGRKKAHQKLSAVIPQLKKINSIINFGICGSLTPEFEVGNIALIQKIFAAHEPDYVCTSITRHPNWKIADLFTADRPILDSNQALALSHTAPLVDCEAHGLAQAAHFFQQPFVSLKVISDLPWRPHAPVTPEEIKKNAAKWSALLLEAFSQTLKK